MTRLIDADAFIEDMKDLYRRAGWDPREVHFSLLDVISNIKCTYRVDAEPVIRCKDCTWCFAPKNGGWEKHHYVCVVGLEPTFVEGEAFCSQGERGKPDETDQR